MRIASTQFSCPISYARKYVVRQMRMIKPIYAVVFISLNWWRETKVALNSSTKYDNAYFYLKDPDRKSVV